jgi:hypothetical protein
MATLVEEFENIAKQLGATLRISESTVGVGGGATSPHCVFLLDLIYKGKTIHIKTLLELIFMGIFNQQFCLRKVPLNLN